MPEETDEEIVLAYKNGDSAVFQKLVNRYTSALYNFSARLSGKSEAPDVVQEIFIKTWKNISRFDPERAKFKTWLFTIAKNANTDFLRKKKNILFSDMEKAGEEETFGENIPDEKILPDGALQKLQDKELLDKMLALLEPAYSEVLTLHYDEEMTFEEIGKVLSKSPNTVKSQHRRALQKLRKMLN